MDSKYPACLQQTSFKTFQFKFLPPPPLQSVQNHGNLQLWEFCYVTWLVMASLPPGRGKAWPFRQLVFLSEPDLFKSLLAGCLQELALHSCTERDLLLLFNPCKQLALAIIMSVFKYLMHNLFMHSTAEITQHKLLIYSSLLKLSQANLN